MNISTQEDYKSQRRYVPALEQSTVFQACPLTLAPFTVLDFARISSTSTWHCEKLSATVSALELLDPTLDPTSRGKGKKLTDKVIPHFGIVFMLLVRCPRIIRNCKRPTTLEHDGDGPL